MKKTLYHISLRILSCFFKLNSMNDLQATHRMIHFFERYYKLIGCQSLNLRLLRDIYAFTHKKVRFIHIGASDGVNDDPLESRIKLHNWKGVLIEPVYYLYKKLRNHYSDCSGLIFAKVAISDKTGTLPFFRIDEKADLPDFVDGIGSLSKDVLFKYKDLLDDFENHIICDVVASYTLSDFFKAYKLEMPDFFYVAAEGYELKILKQIELEIGPEVILFEHKNIVPEAFEAFSKELIAAGYKIFSDEKDSWVIRIYS